ncbi:MAG: sugar ABC transporter substrate-binding protein [Lachnospiraceae bacterium]|nr:sugar ABC transporter substrate-binding protein [Lachnospiraceae bacterium]MCI1424775.1 sugar ABC transporter substrate-binding protein [Lachnospiraceae bacterium]MCI1453490.1 sugar ABC transporter substrate-binding protein [Lachnospiraceae bacterium]
MKKKALSVLLMTVMGAALLAGCGSSSGSGSTGADSAATTGAAEAGTETASASDGSALQVDIWDNNQLDGLQQIADEWTKTSGVPVKINVITWDQYWTLLEAGASGGQMPDVFWMHSNTAQMYMENDMLLNLDDYIAKDDAIDLSNYYDGIVALYSSNGHQYALPKDHDTIALLYNQAIFDKYGVDTPTDDWTWEDVYNASKAITDAGKADGVYGYAMNTSNNQDGWYNFIYDYGGQVITDDHKGTTIGSDASKAGMEMVRKILTTAVPQTMVAESGTDSLFQSNVVGMITQGSWMVNSFYSAEGHENYKWAVLPYADVNGNGSCDAGERQSCYNGLGWAIAANTEHPDEAYSLISYFASEEGQKKQAELGVTMAAYKGMSDAFTSAFDGMDLSAFTKIEDDGTLYFRPYTRKTTVWEDAIQQQGCFLDAWQDPSDPDKMSAACDNAQKIIEDAIAAE